MTKLALPAVLRATTMGATGASAAHRLFCEATLPVLP
eukprot:CAMPEP_0195067182 /NCGR_PEP_ID=MMETSP0448-20130528/12323_1 /TAXON_ID=66468 /ORGANISM="Heterocapsa triquestra, Strain CCMP 448" /LENGTH=36 /DNA_ID= /DNA_START= /DNA_END= /DNA_ORIENTATION=